MLTAGDLRGLYAIIPTPAKPGSDRWDAVDTVDLAETERVIEALIRDGADGLIVLGTTGECATVTRDEFEAFVDCTLATVGKRIPTFIGTTQLGTHEVVYRTRFAQQQGADGILLGLPMWQPLLVNAAVEYYKSISDAFPGLAIMVYANSRAFRFPFAPEFWEAVVKAAPNVMSAKFARPADLPGVLAVAGGRVNFLPHEAAVLKFHEISPETTTACWSTSASMGPEPAKAIMRALLGNDVDSARAIAKDLAWTEAPLEAVIHQPELLAALNLQLEKIRINAAGYCNPGPIRPPYHVVADEYVAMARENGERWKSLRPKYAVAAAP
jgi:dihydrodipicolinate synthase/N-acetylneuraminate lyase